MQLEDAGVRPASPVVRALQKFAPSPPTDDHPEPPKGRPEPAQGWPSPPRDRDSRASSPLSGGSPGARSPSARSSGARSAGARSPSARSPSARSVRSPRETRFRSDFLTFEEPPAVASGREAENGHYEEPYQEHNESVGAIATQLLVDTPAETAARVEWDSGARSPESSAAGRSVAGSASSSRRHGSSRPTSAKLNAGQMAQAYYSKLYGVSGKKPRSRPASATAESSRAGAARGSGSGTREQPRPAQPGSPFDAPRRARPHSSTAYRSAHTHYPDKFALTDDSPSPGKRSAAAPAAASARDTPAALAETAPASMSALLKDGGGGGKFSLRRLLAETGGGPKAAGAAPKTGRARANSASGAQSAAASPSMLRRIASTSTRRTASGAPPSGQAARRGSSASRR